MNAKELMIGDLVVYTGDVEYNDPIIIEGMDIATDSCITSDRDDVGFEGVQPIPLTSEILENNGFPFNEVETNSSIQSVYKHYTKFYDFPLGKGFYIEYDTVDNIFYITDHCWIRFKYVHEFQHVLKLCGINKDIKLKFNN